MPRFALPLLLLIGLSAEAASGASSGQIGTLAIGRYDCERPGEAASAQPRTEPEASFTVASSSRYLAADGSYGTYLLTGDTVTMTSGKLAGARLKRRGTRFLRRIEADGQPGPVRCVLSRASQQL